MRRHDLAAVLGLAAPAAIHVEPVDDECVFRLFRPETPARIYQEVRWPGACERTSSYSFHPTQNRLLLTIRGSMIDVDLDAATARDIPALPGGIPADGATYDQAGVLVAQGTLGQKRAGERGCRRDSTCHFTYGGERYSFSTEGLSLGGWLVRSWRLRGDRWVVAETAVIELHEGLVFPPAPLINNPEMEIHSFSRLEIPGCYPDFKGRDGLCDERRRPQEFDRYIVPGTFTDSLTHSWYVTTAEHPLAVPYYSFEGAKLDGPLLWQTSDGWVPIPELGLDWHGVSPREPYLLVCGPDPQDPDGPGISRIFDMRTHELIWGAKGLCAAWWEPTRESLEALALPPVVGEPEL